MHNKIDNYIKQKHYRLVNSVVVYKDNDLIVERYYNNRNETSRNNIKSIWKSIVSICIGICLDKGFIKNLNEPVADYLEEFKQNIHPYHKLITIRDLLTMSSGIYWNGGIHYHCPMLLQLFHSSNWLAHITDVAVTEFPGSKHVYKEWDVILLSALINRASGMKTYDFCSQFLYKPLVIQSGGWGESPCGIHYTAIDGQEEKSDLTAKELAKIGLLFLNNGEWNNEQIVSGEYIKQAVTPSPQNKNYGFLWWLFDGGYSCKGYGGQEVNVVPEENLVVVIQATPTSQSKSYGDIFTDVIRRNCDVNFAKRY
jgi:CubicO group peptidase (beta-lactamase class C family)